MIHDKFMHRFMVCTKLCCFFPFIIHAASPSVLWSWNFSGNWAMSRFKASEKLKSLVVWVEEQVGQESNYSWKGHPYILKTFHQLLLIHGFQTLSEGQERFLWGSTVSEVTKARQLILKESNVVTHCKHDCFQLSSLNNHISSFQHLKNIYLLLVSLLYLFSNFFPYFIS